MALVLKDRVKVTSTTTGTGTFTLGPAFTGYDNFSVIGDGNTTYYTIALAAEWEVGIGTYTASGTTLSRDTVLASSNSGSLVNFGSGTKEVFVTYPAEKSLNTADIGVTVQAYDADTTKNDVANTFTANQTINADLDINNNLDVQGTITTPTNPATEHDVVNLGYLERYANNLRVDYTKPIVPHLYGLCFTATNGYTYMLTTFGTNNPLDAPYFGSGGAQPAGGVLLLKFPDYPHNATSQITGYVQYSVAMDFNINLTYALTNDGRLVATGEAGVGNFGLGNTTDIQEFRVIASASTFGGSAPIKYQTNSGKRAIAAGNVTVWVLTANGSVYACGEGATGALGQGSVVDSSSWIQTQTSAGVFMTDLVDIWAPTYNTSPQIIGRKSDGTWWGLGDGASGILGGGVVTDRTFWTQITELPTTAVRKVTFNGVNTTKSCYILFEDDTLWSSGNNTSGNQDQGNLTLKTTYSQIEADVADFWSGPEEGVANTTVWIKTTSNVLQTVGEANQYQTLMGNVTDKTTFSAATDIPSNSTLDEVWPLVCAETVFAAWQRWTDNTTGAKTVYAIGYANDGTLGTNNFAATTVNVSINNYLPTDPANIVWMGGMHWTTATFKGLGWMVDNDGYLYVSGRQNIRTASATYGGTNFPYREGPNGGCEFFTAVPLFGALAS